MMSSAVQRQAGPEREPTARILRRRGIHSRYQLDTHEQIEVLMEPDQDEDVRVYGWLLRHANGYALEPHSIADAGEGQAKLKVWSPVRLPDGTPVDPDENSFRTVCSAATGAFRYHGRCAMKMASNKKVPATQQDCAAELTALNEKADLRDEGGNVIPFTPQQVNRALARLEKQGRARRHSLGPNRVLLFCYVRPPTGEALKRRQDRHRENEEPDAARTAKSTTVSGWKTITCRPAEASFRVRLDIPEVTSPDKRREIEALVQKWTALIRPEIESIIRTDDSYKEESKVEIKDYAAAATTLDAELGNPPEKAAAASAGNGQNREKQKQPRAQIGQWPLTIAKVRQWYPDSGEPFLETLLVRCLSKRPTLTDAELADCLVKKKWQDSAALFWITAPEMIDRLNETGVAQAVEQEREHHYENINRETEAMVDRKLSDPALSKPDRDLLARDFPDLVKKFDERKGGKGS